MPVPDYMSGTGICYNNRENTATQAVFFLPILCKKSLKTPAIMVVNRKNNEKKYVENRFFGKNGQKPFLFFKNATIIYMHDILMS